MSDTLEVYLLLGCLALLVGPTVVLLVVFWAVESRRRRRDRLDDLNPRCRVCGYSLRGGSSGRCPECGTEAEDTPERSAHEPGSKV